MMFLKQLRLQNFCNFTDYTFDFTRGDGTPYPFVCFYGPNGIGKSTLLEAISLLTSDQTGRPESYVRNSLRKYVRNPDYNPSYQKLLGQSYSNEFISGEGNEGLPDMLIEGIYCLDDREYVVSMNQNGWQLNELSTNEGGPWTDDLALRRRLVYSIKTDSDLSLNSFQIHRSHKKDFEKLISTVMRYPVQCVEPSDLEGGTVNDFCTDVVLVKNNHRIHFKRMSAGERKICKSFSEILNLMNALENPNSEDVSMPGFPRLLLMDNIVMHVYYDRHATMIECLKNVFSKQQIFATTHSGTLISRQENGENDVDNELWIDLESING